MQVWIREESSMSGAKTLINPAYTEALACDISCEDAAKEWFSYKPVEFEGEEIGNDRIIVDSKVYDICRDDGMALIRERALSKLTVIEKVALKLTADLVTSQKPLSEPM